MGKPKIISGKDAVRLCRKSEEIDRIVNGKGSHVRVYPKNKNHPIMVIPRHDKTMGKGICSKIIKWMKLVGVMSILGGLVWIGSLFLS